MSETLFQVRTMTPVLAFNIAWIGFAVLSGIFLCAGDWRAFTDYSLYTLAFIALSKIEEMQAKGGNRP